MLNEVEAVQAVEEMAYKDAITGQPLNTKLVEEARRKELEYFESKGVWHRRPQSEAFKVIGKAPITVKLVDVNKGNDANPMYRSRLVARELRLPGQESIFAPAPPQEALRTVLSMAATDIKGAHKHDRRAESEMRTQVGVIDISRAYFNAVKDPEVDPTYAELPREDPGRAQGQCGLLRVRMYGTREAADGWHSEYFGFLKELGFAMGDASACAFRHARR